MVLHPFMCLSRPQDVVKEEFYSQQSRLNELKLQVVSSPEELKEVCGGRRRGEVCICVTVL